MFLLSLHLGESRPNSHKTAYWKPRSEYVQLFLGGTALRWHRRTSALGYHDPRKDSVQDQLFLWNHFEKCRDWSTSLFLREV